MPTFYNISVLFNHFLITVFLCFPADIPEYHFLPVEYFALTRGLGAVPVAPTSSAGEENLLCLTEEDSNQDEDIMLRQIAQGIVHLAVRRLDDFDRKLTELYESAMASLWWQGTYATHSKEAYLVRE